MPWEKEAHDHCGLQGRGSLARQRVRERLSRPFRPQRFNHSSTQGIGLRPQPWARISRPVGPAEPATLRIKAIPTGGVTEDIITVNPILSQSLNTDQGSSDSADGVFTDEIWVVVSIPQ